MKTQSLGWLICLFSLLVVIFCLGCSDETKPTRPGNPDAPIFGDNFSPANRSENQQQHVTLCWTCSDPNGDSLTYDLYFGEEYPPPLIDSAITDTVYNTPSLRPDRIYYWCVIARDPYGNTASSPILSFTRILLSDFIYPLLVGNRWEYSGEFILFNFSYDSLNYPQSADTIRSTSMVNIAAVDTFFDTMVVYRFHEEFRQWHETYYSDNYFCNLDDGLYSFGHSHSTGGHAIPLKSRPGNYFRYRERNYESIYALFRALGNDTELTAKIADTILYEKPSLKCLHYPLEIGIQWNFRKTENLWRIDKKIMDFDIVNVPAGNFDCYEVCWFWDSNDDGEWDTNIERHDYISQYGLVSRRTLVRGIMIIDYLGSDTLGTFDVQENFILTNYQVR